MICVPVEPFTASEVLEGVPTDQVRIISQHYVHDLDGRKHGPHGEPGKVRGVAVYTCSCDIQGLQSKWLSLKSVASMTGIPGTKRQAERCPVCLTHHAGEC